MVSAVCKSHLLHISPPYSCYSHRLDWAHVVLSSEMDEWQSATVITGTKLIPDMIIVLFTYLLAYYQTKCLTSFCLCWMHVLVLSVWKSMPERCNLTLADGWLWWYFSAQITGGLALHCHTSPTNNYYSCLWASWLRREISAPTTFSSFIFVLSLIINLFWNCIAMAMVFFLIVCTFWIVFFYYFRSRKWNNIWLLVELVM